MMSGGSMMVFSFSAPKIESRSPVALEHMVRSLNGYALPPMARALAALEASLAAW